MYKFNPKKFVKGIALSAVISLTTVLGSVAQYTNLEVTALTQSESYSWQNVNIGGGGGFIPGIIFNPTEEGLFIVVRIWAVYIVGIRKLRNGFPYRLGFS